MTPLNRTPIFRALTQPQMFAGVTYSYFVINLVVTTEIFNSGSRRHSCDWLYGLFAGAPDFRSLDYENKPLRPHAHA